MKKAIRMMALIMVLLLTVALVAGCGDEPSSSNTGSSGGDSGSGSGSTEVKGSAIDRIEPGLYDFGGMTITLADQFPHELKPGLSTEIDRLIERIEMLKNNWNVNVEFKTVDADTYWEGMVTAVMGNEAFGDIMFAFPWYMTDWIAGGAVRDLKPIAQKLGLDFNDGTWNKIVEKDCTIGNALYGVSRGYPELQYSIVYNPKMFAAENLTDPNELIAAGGTSAWNFDTLREYANKLTKFDASGEPTQTGLAAVGTRFITASFVVGNGGAFVNYDENDMPSFGLTDPKALEAMQYVQDMAYVDKSLMSTDWQGAAQKLLNGEIGMYACEEWVVEYIQQYAAENGMEENYAMTYFPVGPSATEFVDTGYGGNSYFIPTTISDERAEAALAVYAALYTPPLDMSKEEVVTQRAEELFADEASANVYIDIIMNDRARSGDYARMGLYEIMSTLTVDIFEGVGTPQSTVETYRAEIEGLLADSAYVKALQNQRQ